MPTGGCGTIAADDEGGVWLASSGHDPVVFRVLGQLVDRLGVPARPPGTIFDGTPLVAAAGGTVVAAVPQPGGVAPSVAPAVVLTTDLELDVAMSPASGATPGHPVPAAVARLDDTGRTIGVTTYPVVTDAPDGSYRWATATDAAVLDERGQWTPDAAAAPIGANGSLGGIVTVGSGQVSLATELDADVPPGTAGPLGDVVATRRTTGPWSAREVVAGGPGRQAVDAVVAVGTRVVGVGEQVVVDPASGVPAATPLVLLGDGGAFRALPVDAPGVSFGAACAGPGGSVVALGTDATSGTSVVASIDPVAEQVELRPGPAGPAVTWCAGDGEHVLLAAGRSLFGSDDATTFQPLDVLQPGEVVTAVAAGRRRLRGHRLWRDGRRVRARRGVAVDAAPARRAGAGGSG